MIWNSFVSFNAGTENVKADKINIEKRLQCLETKVEWLEMEKSTEKSVKQGPTRENTCKGKISDEIDKDPCVMQENIKIVCENEKMPAGRSSELENNTSDEGNERHLNGRLEEIRLADRIQKDTMERDQASQRRNGVEVQQWYDGKLPYCSQGRVNWNWTIDELPSDIVVTTFFS